MQGSSHGRPTLLMPSTPTLLLGLRIFPRFPESEIPLTLRHQPAGAQEPSPVGEREGSDEEIPRQAPQPC